jgi:hypothetical protein
MEIKKVMQEHHLNPFLVQGLTLAVFSFPFRSAAWHWSAGTSVSLSIILAFLNLSIVFCAPFSKLFHGSCLVK